MVVTMKIALFALGNLYLAQGFVPTASVKTNNNFAAFYALPKELEKEMRQELAERSSKVPEEEKYALRDGPVVPATELQEEPPVSSDPGESIPGETEGHRLKRRMDRLTKRRPYPLFLAEKGLELVEGIFPQQSSSTPTKKERVVLLGTGWGAVSFLKSIDTTLYDVTVISPRNYFLFTPMLGELVGRCITLHDTTCRSILFMFGFRLMSRRTCPLDLQLEQVLEP